MRPPAGRSAAVTALALVAVTLLVVTLWRTTGGDDESPPSQARPFPNQRPDLPTSFRVATFNVLSAWHTSPRGPNRRRESGAVRMGYTARLLDRHEISVAGLQELQGSQYAELQRRREGTWEGYPGLELRTQDSRNSIIWRTADWVALERRTVEVPYFRGKPTRAPYVLLRSRATGQQVWFANFHNPANGRFRGDHAAWRIEATAIQADLANDLRASGQPQGIPVVFTGDMNEQASYFCRLTTNTQMKSANGGSFGSQECDPPDSRRIDWIFGSKELDLTDYRVVRSALVERASDHPLVMSEVSVPVD